MEEDEEAIMIIMMLSINYALSLSNTVVGG